MAKVNQNGNRILLAAIVLPLAAIAILGIVLFATTRGSASFHPIEIRPPIVGSLKIANRVEGVDGPALHQSDLLHITPSGSRSCNTLDHPIQETVDVFYTALDVQFHQVKGLPAPLVRAMAPGCPEPMPSAGIALPAEVTTGRWTLTIQIVASDQGRDQTLTFVTEPFEVVP